MQRWATPRSPERLDFALIRVTLFSGIIAVRLGSGRFSSPGTLADGKKVLLLSPRRFVKTSLVAVAPFWLEKRHIRTISRTGSSDSSYTQFLEKFVKKCCARPGPGIASNTGRRASVARSSPNSTTT